MIKRIVESLICILLIGVMFSACSTPGTSTNSTTGTIQPTTPPAATPSVTETAVIIELKGIGNSVGNIINSGLIASKDGWVYYNSSPDSEINESALYKAKVDGSDKTKLADDSPYFINVAGEWIFYVNASDEHTIYRIKTDGTSREKLTEKAVWSMMVIDNWIYYAQQYSPPEIQENAGGRH